MTMKQCEGILKTLCGKLLFNSIRQIAVSLDRLGTIRITKHWKPSTAPQPCENISGNFFYQ